MKVRNLLLIGAGMALGRAGLAAQLTRPLSETELESFTWRSIGPIGLGLVAAFFGAILWALFYYGLLQPDQTTVIAYILLIVAATVMAIGLSWSHIRRRLSGQLDTTEIPE